VKRFFTETTWRAVDRSQLGLSSNHLASRHDWSVDKPMALVPFVFGVRKLVESLE